MFVSLPRGRDTRTAAAARGIRRRAAQALAAGAGGVQALAAAFDDELRERGEDTGLFVPMLVMPRFMLEPTPGTIPPLQARLVAVTLADQAGSALDTAASGSGG
ncbi:hypothetical protein [Streptosporangium sp. NPDC000396]|uniref:hypothetical protein n=1 Tax=Streptosporangium sp. NPDC000396 TaxID=3366185 RepID=UPI00367837A8